MIDINLIPIFNCFIDLKLQIYDRTHLYELYYTLGIIIFVVLSVIIYI